MEKVTINTKKEFWDATMKYDIPDRILLDVKSRMLDWIMMGGTFEDDYMLKQYKYIERYINIIILKIDE